MVIPAAMQIYAGGELLQRMDSAARDDQLKELRSARAQLDQYYGAVDSLEFGFELGLAVARVILSTSGLLAQKGVDGTAIL